MSTMGGSGGGGNVHPKGESSMVVLMFSQNQVGHFNS